MLKDLAALACLLRELTAVTETGTADDVIWGRQAIDALLDLKQAADAARAAGGHASFPHATGKITPCRCGTNDL